MFTSSSIVIKKKKIKHIIIILSIILIIIPFILEGFDIYKNLNQIEIIKKLRKCLGDKGTKIIVIISSLFWKKYFLFFLVIVFFNYSNIYKTFILFNLISFQYLFSAIIKFIYKQNFPYLHKEQIKPYFCELGFGLPSTSVLIIIPFYLSIWNMIFDKRIKNGNYFLKLFTIILIILIILVTILGELVNGYYYLNQIIFSIICGIGFYLFLFIGCNIDANDGKQFYTLIKKKIYFYFSMYCLFLILIIIPFIVLNKRKYKNFDKKCIGKLEWSNPKIEEGNFKWYNENTFYLISYIMASFFSILGVKLELRNTLKDHTINWRQFNFYDDEDDDNVMNGDQFDVKITKNTKWNNTKNHISNFRFFIILILSSICFIPYFLISYDKNFFLVLFIKLMTPLCLFSFGIFFLFKRLLMKTSLINTELFSIVDNKTMISLIKEDSRS